MKHLFVVWVIAVSIGFLPAHGQDTSFRLIGQIPFPVSYVTTNLVDELFIVGKDNLLRKYDSNGDSVGVFNNVKKYGKLSYVEAQNPWKTILFYENFQTLVLLDKYLKDLGSISLREKNIYQVKAVTTSYDNNIWLFDGREYKIRKIDDNGQILASSVDLRQLFDESPNPERIYDRDGLVYLYDPALGFYVFDYYGAFKMKLSFKNWNSVYVVGRSLIGYDGQYMYQYAPPVPVATPVLLPPALQYADMISIASKKIYVLKNGILSIYER